MPATPSRPGGSVAGGLAVVYVTWGSTYVAMRVAVRSLPPLTLTGARFLVAGLLLYGWCGWQRRRHPGAGWRNLTRREWRASAILGITLPAAGTGSATWAEQKILAGTAALLLATIPVWMIIASRIADRERITVLTAAGMILGLAGVGTLINPFAGGALDLLASRRRRAQRRTWRPGTPTRPMTRPSSNGGREGPPLPRPAPPGTTWFASTRRGASSSAGRGSSASRLPITSASSTSQRRSMSPRASRSGGCPGTLRRAFSCRWRISGCSMTGSCASGSSPGRGVPAA